MKKLITYLIVVLIVGGCEDPITVDSGFEDASLVVDAWVDNLNRTQKVRLTLSQDYFENTFSDGVVGAEVKIIVEGTEEVIFTDQGNGDYIWEPTSEKPTLGSVGQEFTLDVMANGVKYTATTQMNRVPEIDSIAQVYEEETIAFPEGIYAELFARDLPGTGDTYWVKTYKNGQFLNKPLEMLLIYDSTFDGGTGLDGEVFIFPLRRGINPVPDDFDDLGEELPPPYMTGDSIYVELQSVSNEGFRFLQIAFEQMTNGLNGIFALPVANAESNVIQESTNEPILGFFNVAAISTESTVIR